MKDITEMSVEDIYKHFKNPANHRYHEANHCKLLIKTMMDEDQGTYSAFCVKALISEKTFFCWVREYQTFCNVYYFCQIVARKAWEDEGRRLKNFEYPMGMMNNSFEYWKMVGWSRFGISRNSRLKLNLKAEEDPAKHYASILRQAAEGDFTAAEFKQLMEAVNVGLNVHQVFELQKQIDELKSDLATMTANAGVQNPFTNKGIAQKD